jgi:hypothetical protein
MNLSSARETTAWKKFVAFVGAFDTSGYTPYDHLADRVNRLEREIARFKRTYVDHASSEEEAKRL